MRRILGGQRPESIDLDWDVRILLRIRGGADRNPLIGTYNVTRIPRRLPIRNPFIDGGVDPITRILRGGDRESNLGSIGGVLD